MTDPRHTTTVAFTGHRTLCGPRGQGVLFGCDPEHLESSIRMELDAALGRLAAEGYDRFLCGMAMGFDLMAAEAVLRLKRKFAGVRLVALIPYPGQSRGFPAKERERYEKVLAAADEAVTVCDRYSSDCFHRRNDRLVESGSVMVAYYDGSPGGTRYTVRRTAANGLRVINLYERINTISLP